MNKRIYTLIAVAFVGTASTFAAEPDSTMVNIAYGSEPEWRVTSSVATLDGDELLRTTSPSVGNAIAGKLPGLTLFQWGGQPRYDFGISSLAMRGKTSYTSGNMLVFVDGFESSLDNLTAAEIESVSLLKDASALALYGARGANGVILVTTRRGIEGKPAIKVRLQTGIQTMISSADPVDSYTYATLYNQACVNDGLAPEYSEYALEAYKDGTDPYLYPNVNWKKEMLRPVAPLSSADVTFRGGNKIVKYFALLSAAGTSGYFKGTDPKKNESSNAGYNTVNFRSNIDLNLARGLSAAFTFGGRIGIMSFPGGGVTTSGLFKSMYSTPPNAFPVHNPDGSWGGNSTQTNPVGDLTAKGAYKENNRSMQLVFTPRYDLDFITDGLSVSASVAYGSQMAETSEKKRDYARYSVYKDIDEYYYIQYGTDKPLEAAEGFLNDWSRVNVKGSVDYSNAFGKHSIDASAFALVDNYREYYEKSDIRYVNFAGRAAYSYDKRYVAEFVASCMGCDNYAPGHRFGFFPAGSLGWVMSEEPWLKGVSLIDFLKLRASAGLVGNNQQNGRYLYDESYGYTGEYIFGTGSSSTGGYGLGTPNPELTWERQTIYNAGLEARLFGSLGIIVDVFSQIRSGIVDRAYAKTPGLTGAAFGDILPYINVGTVMNRGFELSAEWTQRISDDFDWNIRAGVWYARNEVMDMGESTKLYDYQYQKGHPVGTPFALESVGYWQENDFNPDGTVADGIPVPQFGKVRPGDIKYKDQNSDGVIDGNDSVAAGYSYIPEWNLTFGGGFRWRDLEFEMSFHGECNKDIFLSGASVWSFQDNSSVSALAVDSWTPENPDASYPRLSTVNFSNNYRTSTFWKRDGSFLRLKNIYLAYNLPLHRQDIGVAFYLSATNLFTISAVGDLFDPAIGSVAAYPLSKTFSLGVKLNL